MPGVIEGRDVRLILGVRILKRQPEPGSKVTDSRTGQLVDVVSADRGPVRGERVGVSIVLSVVIERQLQRGGGQRLVGDAGG